MPMTSVSYADFDVFEQTYQSNPNQDLTQHDLGLRDRPVRPTLANLGP